jgi:segregation and condensation protein A
MTPENFLIANDSPDRPIQLLLDLEGFEGPIDLMLTLARDQKLDLTRISILALAEQYLAFIDQAKALRLELAADYLVMAAWLAYLKSKMMLPPSEQVRDEPSPSELAEALAFQLQRLQSIQVAAGHLMSLPRLDHGVYRRGETEDLEIIVRPVYGIGLYDLLAAYGDVQRRQFNSVYTLQDIELFAVEAAIDRLKQMLGSGAWTSLASLIPRGLKSNLTQRSALASTFLASLELAKSGMLELRQDGAFADIYLRARKEKRDD